MPKKSTLFKVAFRRMELPDAAAYRSPNSSAYKVWMQLKEQLRCRDEFKADPNNKDVDYTFGQDCDTYEAARALQQTIFNEAGRLGWASSRIASRNERDNKKKPAPTVVYFTNLMQAESGHGYTVFVTLQ